MHLTLPELPYPHHALEPHMSRQTLEYHHGKHHKAYVDKTNQLIAGTRFQDMPLEDIVCNSGGKLFNQAAQAWNHAFFWQCLTPEQAPPAERVLALLQRSFGGLDPFIRQFNEAGADLFGSGWVWLVRKTPSELAIVSKPGAGNPLTSGQQPLLCCDVWEHAYYLDCRNARAEYLQRFWRLANWSFVERNLEHEFHRAAAGKTGLLQAPAAH